MEVFYYPRTSRKILIAFLDFFNDMYVYNYTSGTSNQVEKIIKVPIKFGLSSKEYLFNLQQDSGKKYYPKVPSLMVSMDNMSYNSERAISVNETRSFYNTNLNIYDNDDFWQDVIPTPYDYFYTLEIYTESFDHMYQLIENINAYFNPTNHLRIKEFDFLNLERDIRVELTDTSIDQQQSLGEEESRYFSAKIKFKADAVLYRPISESKIIKYIKTNYNYGSGKEIYSTSGLPSSAISPINYNWSFGINSSATGYVEVSE
jgi:hypothetical protein